MDPQAELSVIACEIFKPGCWATAGIDRTDFYSPKALALFGVVEAIKLANAPLSLSTVRHFLETEEHAELYSAVGGQVIFDEIAVREPDVILLSYYAGIVKEKSRRRLLKERALLLADTADDESRDLSSLIGQADFADLHLPDRDSFTLRSLIEAYPNLAEPLVDGLVRRGEVANLIAPTKVGKSWLSYGLALSIITGRDWFGFPTRAGRVLLIDNELHKATIADRLQKVGKTMGLRLDDFVDFLTVWPFRGRGMDVYAIGRRLNRVPARFFSCVILDAKYRALPVGTSENDNAAEAAFYNEEDRWAEMLEASVFNVHHSTKGDQSEKRVTDIGAGGGAQSRAADTHIALREHESADTFVLEAAVRSFKPIEPIALVWQFPVWVPDSTVDTSKLKRQPTRGDDNQSAKDREADDAVLAVCETWMTRGEIAQKTFSEGRANRAIARLVKARLLEAGKEDRPRHPDTEVFRRSIFARGDQLDVTNSTAVGDQVGGVALADDQLHTRPLKGGRGGGGQSGRTTNATGSDGVGQPDGWDDFK